MTKFIFRPDKGITTTEKDAPMFPQFHLVKKGGVWQLDMKPELTAEQEDHLEIQNVDAELEKKSDQEPQELEPEPEIEFK